jgi:hypothetical protein
LLPMRGVSHCMWRLVRRNREQAPSHILERERQLDRDLLALCQPMLKLRRVMNQHILPGKRLRRDQA